MKGIVVLMLVLFLVTAPAFGELTEERVMQIVAASDERMLAEFRKLQAELNEVKTELRVLKAEVGVLRAEVGMLQQQVGKLQEDVSVLQQQVARLEGEVSGNSARITDVRVQLTWQSTGLLTVAGLLATVLLWMLKKMWDERRADRDKLDAKEVELAAKEAEILRLRAENERLKPRIVAERGEAANVSGNAP